MDCEKHIVYLMVIADRKKKDEIAAVLCQNSARVNLAMYGEGSVKAGTVQKVFGFVPEQHKVIVTCLLTQERADAIIQILNTEYHFYKPNTGIAFTIPVDGLSY